MNRRTVLYGLGAGLLAAAPGPTHLIETFREGLRDLGYVENRNLVIEWRWADFKAEQLGDLAADLVRLKVDVIVAPTPLELRASKQATVTIPIVMVTSGNPVGQGFVRSLAQPGGNITGTSSMVTDIVGKQLEVLTEVVPQLSRVAILHNPDNITSIPELKGVAPAVKVRLQFVDVRSPGDINAAFSAMVRERAQALLVMPDTMLLGYRDRLADLAARNHLPSVYQIREHAEAGGLIAYGASRLELFRRAAGYVDRILKGAKPSDLPVDQRPNLSWSSTSRPPRPSASPSPVAAAAGRSGDRIGAKP